VSKDRSKEPGGARQARVESGIPRLDYILKGGFMPGGIYTVMGPPGSGKTILGNQLCFNQIRSAGRRCVYLTLLVESHAKMFGHLSSLEFFDEKFIPEHLYYVSGYQVMKSAGFSGLLELVRKTLKERKATILILDGLESAEEHAQSLQSFREFIHELQGFTALMGCTTLLLTTSRTRTQVEHSLVDGVIELSDQLVGPRAVRELTVHKFRGSNYLRGRHEVEIQESGIVIHPRTEIQFGSPPEEATEQRIRMPFGISKLDEMLYGGIPTGSTVALLGAPGTGKTLMGLSFLVEGAKNGQHGMYFGFYEPPPRLCEKAGQVGVELDKYVKKGLIELIWQPPLEHMMDALAEQLLERISDRPKPRRRLFIDGIEGFRAAAVYHDRIPRFLSAITNQLRMLDVTTVVSEELELFKPEVSMPNPELANVVETVILLRYVELRSQLYRLLSIMKMRESRYETSIREFRITAGGVVVAESFESAEAILTGHAKTIATPPPLRAEGAQ
jgi:circadian clock protein KaiC